MDIVNKVRNQPLPGETIQSLGTAYSPGGKGANQAIAAHLLGEKVSMVGAVGQDGFGEQLLSNFQKCGLETKHIYAKDSNSGTAFITIDEQGENQIIISAGANGKLNIEDVGEILCKDDWDTVLLQNEISWNVTAYVIEEASRRGMKVAFNPAPAIKISKDILSLIDLLILNETETEYITGIEVSDRSSALKAAQSIIRSGVKEVIITLGNKGVLYFNCHQEEVFQSAFSVKVVDTTAAGDTFLGAFMAARRNAYTTKDCLTFACAAAALAVTKQGAQNSIPTFQEVTEFLKVPGT